MNGLFDPWCNGNTADFGSVIPGSNPGGSTTSDKQLFIRRFFIHIVDCRLNVKRSNLQFWLRNVKLTQCEFAIDWAWVC